MFVSNPANRCEITKSDQAVNGRIKLVAQGCFSSRDELSDWIDNGLEKLVEKFERFETTASRRGHFSR